MHHNAVCWGWGISQGWGHACMRAADARQTSGRLHACAWQLHVAHAGMRQGACEDCQKHLLQALQCLDRSGLTTWQLVHKPMLAK